MANENYYDRISINGDERALRDSEARSLIEQNKKYSNSTPTPITLGGIEKGTTFDDKNIKDILDMLLYPYVQFSATLTTNPNGGIKEYGSSITISQANVNITLGSANITSITIKDTSNNTLATKTTNITSGNNAISINKTIKDDETISATILDSKGTIKTISSTKFDFVHPYYVGAINDNVDLTQTLILGLNKKVEAKGTKTYEISMVQQKGVFAYPSNYGEIKKILDENNFNVTNTFNVNLLTINDVEYYVYVLNIPTTSTMKYTFSY